MAHPAADGYLQLLPYRDGADGFFIARLRRTGR
jgi:16S rRNA C967 or C1407 C5-methylase (RsmB/RsmF family)